MARAVPLMRGANRDEIVAHLPERAMQQTPSAAGVGPCPAPRRGLQPARQSRWGLLPAEFSTRWRGTLRAVALALQTITVALQVLAAYLTTGAARAARVRQVLAARAALANRPRPSPKSI